MKKSEYLVNEFLHYHNISTVLNKRRTQNDLMGYDYSELNCIQYIGTLEDPNVTALAKEMNMTRGAISKIVQKLSEKGAITSYQRPGNRQKVYYSLTDLGRTLFDEHERRHEKWRREELKFYDSLDDETLETVTAFMKELNSYLLAQLKKNKK